MDGSALRIADVEDMGVRRCGKSVLIDGLLSWDIDSVASIFIWQVLVRELRQEGVSESYLP